MSRAFPRASGRLNGGSFCTGELSLPQQCRDALSGKLAVAFPLSLPM